MRTPRHHLPAVRLLWPCQRAIIGAASPCRLVLTCWREALQTWVHCKRIYHHEHLESSWGHLSTPKTPASPFSSSTSHWDQRNRPDEVTSWELGFQGLLREVVECINIHHQPEHGKAAVPLWRADDCLTNGFCNKHDGSQCCLYRNIHSPTWSMQWYPSSSSSTSRKGSNICVAMTRQYEMLIQLH